MPVVIDGSTGITTPALTNEGNTTLGDASTDTLNVGNGGLIKDASGNVSVSGKLKTNGATVSSPAFATLTATDRNIGFIDSGSKATLASMNTSFSTYSDVRYLAATHEFAVATTGAPTTAMTLDASGYLKLGGNNGSNRHELWQVTSGAYAVTMGSLNATGSNCYGLNLAYANAAPNGTSNEFLYCGDNVALRASIRSNGGLANYSANNVNLSDARLKRDFTPSQNWLEKLCQIEVGTFFYKDQTDDIPNLGVLAQQVEAVAPELVDPSGFGEAPEGEEPYKAIYQTDLQYALLKAIQELKAENDALKARLDAAGL